MWEIYFNKDMGIKERMNIMNDKDKYITLVSINAYKYGLLLEALGKLKFPN